MGINVFKNGKQCKALRAELYFYLAAGATRATRFFAAEAALLLLNGPTYVALILKPLSVTKSVAMILSPVLHFLHKYAIWYASSERHQITV